MSTPPQRTGKAKVAENRHGRTGEDSSKLSRIGRWWSRSQKAQVEITRLPSSSGSAHTPTDTISSLAVDLSGQLNPPSSQSALDNTVPFLVYAATEEEPRFRIVLRSSGVEYTGTVAILERAYAHPLRPGPGDTVQEVVCKQVVEHGDYGTGEEAKMMALANKQVHECILPYLGSTRFRRDRDTVDSIWLVMPDMPLGDLVAWLRLPDGGPRGDHGTCHQIMRDVLSGLIHLHSNKIVHGDLKTNNVFLWEERTPNGRRLRAKLADFGLSRDTSSNKSPEMETRAQLRLTGSKPFMAPEFLLNEPVPPPGYVSSNSTGFDQNQTLHRGNNRDVEQDNASAYSVRVRGLLSKQTANDVWAFGMVLYHVFSGSAPWAGYFANSQDIPNEVQIGKRPTYPGPQPGRFVFNFKLWRIARDSWRHHPHHRPTVHEISEIWDNPDAASIDSPLSPEPFGPAGILDLTKQISEVADSPSTTAAGCLEFNAEWYAEERAPGYVCVRLLRPDTKEQVDNDGWTHSFRDEVVRWRRLQHENLRPLYGICTVGGDLQWHAVAPLQISFEEWNDEMLLKLGRETKIAAKLWIMLLLDIANALHFLHTQDPPLLHGSVCVDNVFCPSHRYPQFETGSSLNASLGDFRSVRTASDGDVSGDVRAFAKLARHIIDERHRCCKKPAMLQTPPELEVLIETCASTPCTIGQGAIRPLRALLRHRPPVQASSKPKN